MVRCVTLITVVYDLDECLVCILQLCLDVGFYLLIYTVNDTVGETNTQISKDTSLFLLSVVAGGLIDACK